MVHNFILEWDNVNSLFSRNLEDDYKTATAGNKDSKPEDKFKSKPAGSSEPVYNPPSNSTRPKPRPKSHTRLTTDLRIFYISKFVTVNYLKKKKRGHYSIVGVFFLFPLLELQESFEQALREAEGLLNRKGLGNHIYYFTTTLFLFDSHG